MEPCFIWQDGCRNGEQYAAWAQAIGTVAAIIYTGFLARGAERQRLADNDKRTDIYLMELHGYLVQMVHLATLQNHQALINFSRKMSHARDRGRRIDHGLLPYSAAIGIVTIDDSADKVVLLTTNLTVNSNFQQLEGDLRRELDKIDAAGEIIRKALRKRKWWKLNREL